MDGNMSSEQIERDIMNVTDSIHDSLLEKKYFVIGLYVPVFIIALVANVLVILVVIKDQYMRKSLSWSPLPSLEIVTNYFLVNLSVADLLVAIICMPNAAWGAYTAEYNFGEYACKISAYMQCVAVASSIFTITAMAIDRYLAITRPFGFFYRCFNKKTTVIVILALWITSLILFSPLLTITGTQKIPDIPWTDRNITIDAYLCGEDWNRSFISTSFNMQRVLGITWFIFVFVVPGLIMLFAYSMMSRTLCSVVPPFDNNEGISSTQQRNRLIRSRKRVACILLLLAFVFAGCWLPYHIISLLRDANNTKDYNTMYTSWKQYLLLVGHANSALNPIIYCALSRKFRRSIKDMVCVSITFTRKRPHPMQWADSSGSGTQLHYLHRLKSVPTVQNQLYFNLARIPSSQKTTKTCAV